MNRRKIADGVARASIDDYHLGNPQESVEAALKTQTVASVCIALADFSLASNAMTDKQLAKLLIRLYEMYCVFEEKFKETAGGKAKGAKGKGTKGAKKGAADATVQDETIAKEGAQKVAKRPAFEMCSLSLQNVAHFISVVDDDSNDASRDPEVLTLLRSAEQNKLRLWIFQLAVSKYQALRIHGDVEGLSPDSVGKFSGTIGRALLLHVQRAKRIVDELPISIFVSALHCLHEMIQAIVTHHPIKFVRFLMTMDGVDRAAMPLALESQLPKTLQHFRELLNRLLSGRENEDVVAKAVLPIIGILTTLSDSFTDPTCEKYGELLEWTLSLCREVECTEASTVKALMTFLIHLVMSKESNPLVFLQIAKEIRLAIGTLGEGSTSFQRNPNRFSVINDDTAAAVLSVLPAALERLLQVAEWTLGRIGIVEREDASPVVERSIYSRLNLVANCLSELVQADIKAGPNSELVLKISTLFYTVIVNLSVLIGLQLSFMEINR